MYVFTYESNPVKQVSTRAWYKALKRAGIESFRWHNWRHTWASWHVQNGTPLHVLQELGGWETPGMVRRYANLGADHPALCRESRHGGSEWQRLRGRRRQRHGHKSVTATFSLKTDVTVSPRNLGKFMVARGGIEPPTRGFSVRCSTN